jgi:glycogen synthase
LALEGYNKVCKEFSWDKHAHSMVEIYRDLLNQAIGRV